MVFEVLVGFVLVCLDVFLRFEVPSVVLIVADIVLRRAAVRSAQLDRVGAPLPHRIDQTNTEVSAGLPNVSATSTHEDVTEWPLDGASGE